MTENVRNYGSRSGKKVYTLSDSEMKTLATLNDKLNLNLDSGSQGSIDGFRVIVKALREQKWSIYDLHELGISLWSIGVINLKLRGFLGYPYNPFGAHGINRESFIS